MRHTRKLHSLAVAERTQQVANSLHFAVPVQVIGDDDDDDDGVDVETRVKVYIQGTSSCGYAEKLLPR